MKRTIGVLLLFCTIALSCKHKSAEKDDFDKYHKKRPVSPVVKSIKSYVCITDSANPKCREGANTTEEYDAKGQKTKLTQYIGDSGKVQYITTYKYDGKGNAIETHTETPSDNSWSTEKNTFDDDKHIVKTEWGRSDGGTGTHEYKFDALGHMSRWDWNEKGQVVTRLYPMTYDKNDHIIESYAKKIQTTKDTIIEGHEKYTYDSATGKESGKVVFLNDIPLEVLETHYDSAHNKIMEIDRERDTTGRMEARTILYFYNEYGEVTRTQVFKYGKVQSASQNTYDNYGHLTESITTEGGSVKKTRYVYEFYK
jgi:hypothetical protein